MSVAVAVQEAPVADHLVRIDAEPWVRDFAQALATNDGELLAALFTPDATWRDNLSFTWTFRQVYGLENVGDLLWRTADQVHPTDFAVSEEFHPPGEVIFNQEPLIEIMIDFATDAAENLAVIWAVKDDSAPHGFKAFNLYTKLRALKQYPHRAGFKSGHGFTPNHPRQNFLEYRAERHAFNDREPDVLIVGGGHGGLMLAAHLDRLGIDTLIVERNERIGDNWRNRYHNLALHNPTQMNHLPFMRYPDNFAELMPKDQYANFLESYADALDLATWTSTKFVRGDYDETSAGWSALVVGPSGGRVLRPRHIVLATGGIGGQPLIPAIPGLADFSGEVHHTATFRGGAQWSGKNAVVFGAGCSAHDASSELYDQDARVTMIQRGPVTVANVDTANNAYGDYFRGYDPDLVDLRFFAGLVGPMLTPQFQRAQKMMAEMDKDILDRLTAAGFEHDAGHEGTGWLGAFFRKGGGYYLNVGASELIADGKIGIKNYRDVERVVPEGVKFKDGSVLPADVIVLGTGYQNRAGELTQWFDESISGLFRNIGGVDESGEFVNAWVPTAQRGLWFMLGGIQTARPNAPLMANAIKADLAGLIPESARPAAPVIGT